MTTPCCRAGRTPYATSVSHQLIHLHLSNREQCPRLETEEFSAHQAQNASRPGPGAAQPQEALGFGAAGLQRQALPSRAGGATDRGGAAQSCEAAPCPLRPAARVGTDAAGTRGGKGSLRNRLRAATPSGLALGQPDARVGADSAPGAPVPAPCTAPGRGVAPGAGQGRAGQRLGAAGAGGGGSGRSGGSGGPGRAPAPPLQLPASGPRCRRAGVVAEGGPRPLL